MKTIIKRVSALLLVFVMLAAAAVPAGAYTTDEIVQATMEFIISQEGTYTTVDPNDSGALSIGLLGWHATRALNLLKSIVNADPDSAQSALGSSLYNEVVSYSSWNTRTLNAEEAMAVSRLLGTSAGKSVQDSLIRKDVTGYITDAQARGITNAQALILYADVENQCGGGVSYAVGSSAANIAGSFGAITLDVMYQAAMNNGTAGRYSARRKAGYSYAKTHFTGENASPSEDQTDKTSTDGAGTYIVNTTLLNVRSGPSVSTEKVGQLPQNTRITVTGTQNGWAKFSEGWVYMEYLTKVAEETTTKAPETTTATSAGSAKYIVTASSLNIRSTPDTSKEAVGSLRQGDIITITDVTETGWGRFDKGWVYMTYLTKIAEESTTKTPETTTALTSGGQKYKVNHSYLNIRSAPGTSNALVGTLKENDIITITEIKDGWGKFDKGWVFMEYLVKIAEEPSTKAPETTTAQTAAGTKYRVNHSYLNIRSAPGTSNALVGTLKENDIITITDTTKDGWGKFDKGWVFMEYLVAVPAGTTYKVIEISDNTLNIRSGPGTNNPVISSYKSGDIVTVTETTDGGWGKTDKGWVYMSYLTKIGEEGTTAASKTPAYPVYVINVDELNVRAKPDADSEILGALRKGANVTVLEISGAWGKLAYAKGKYGWFSLAYASLKSTAKGDVNGDGRITADDARRALRFSAKLDTYSLGEFSAADANGDGKLLADDARRILRASAKLEPL